MRALIIRLGASLLVGLAMTLIAFLISWRMFGSEFYGNTKLRSETLSTIRDIRVAAEGYKDLYKELPPSLSALSKAKDRVSVKSSSWSPKKKTEWKDGWNQPFHYTVDGTTWTVISYGRDGKPGGVDFDADLSNHNYYHPPQIDFTRPSLRPSLSKFAFQLPTSGVMGAALLAGLLSAIISFKAIDEIMRSPANRFYYILTRIVLITFVTLLMAVMVAYVHIPSSH